MLCWFFRRMISHAADGDGDPGRLTQWHLSRCQFCQQFHTECHLLEQRLRREAPRWAADPRQAPMSSVQPNETRASLSWAARGAIAAAVAVLASLGVFLPTRPQSPITPPDVAVAASGPPISEQRHWTGLIENPLIAEVQSLREEAESGMLFLVACLDVSPLADDGHPPVE